MKLKKPINVAPPAILRLTMGRALKRAVRSGESFANKQIRKEYPFSRAELDKGLSSRFDSISKLKARITAKGTRLPLINFLQGSNRMTTVGGAIKLNRKGGGVRVRVGATAKVIERGPHGNRVFIAQMPTGHIGIFERTGKFGRLGMAKLERIAQLTTLSIADMFLARRVLPEVEKKVQERLRIELDHQMKYAFEHKRPAPE